MFGSPNSYRSILGTLGFVVCVVLADRAIAADETDFFERKIRPVLIEHCYECHAGDADLIQGGLRLDDPNIDAPRR